MDISFVVHSSFYSDGERPQMEDKWMTIAISFLRMFLFFPCVTPRRGILHQEPCCYRCPLKKKDHLPPLFVSSPHRLGGHRATAKFDPGILQFGSGRDLCHAHRFLPWIPHVNGKRLIRNQLLLLRTVNRLPFGNDRCISKLEPRCIPSWCQSFDIRR